MTGEKKELIEVEKKDLQWLYDRTHTDKFMKIEEEERFELIGKKYNLEE